MRTDERIAELFPDRGPRPPDTVTPHPDAPTPAATGVNTLGHPDHGYFDQDPEAGDGD